MDNKPTGNANREPLAIVGIGCRFPGGVEDVDSFWKLLSEGASGIIEVPADRWNKERYYHPETSIPRKMHTKWGGFVKNVDQWDAAFWGISPREALRMDPQQRWLLECAWESIEDAGYRPSNLAGTRTGVYIGIASNDYAQVQMTSPNDVDVHTNSGATLSIASNRIAYLLDLKGPAISVDTACSSALVAINIGCKDMWSGEIDCALVGGVNALLTPDTSIGFSKATMLSPSGQCFAFDDRANGYVRGEGAGVLMIVPLSKAVANGDRIYATVRAAVINQDGNTSSMTVPGQDTQEAMLIQAYGEAGMEPARVTYMEAHGTGTPVGDPIETNALGNILSRGRSKDDKCLIGSVKTNIGHLESGSGAAGMVKAALVLQKGMVPPSLNFQRPNPNIDFEKLKLKVVTEMTPLVSKHGLPVAAVNSFGFGGTNAHIVMEAAPPREEPKKPRSGAIRPFLLPVSGRDESVMRRYAGVYRKFLEDESLDLAEVCYSAGARKEQFEKRAVIIGSHADALRERLRQFSQGNGGEEIEGVITGQKTEEPAPVVFVFTGQGAQWWAMGQQLLTTEPVFRKTIERIDSHVRKLVDWSLLEEMTRDEKTSNINRTYIAQPAIFALQVALAELWKSWGIEPSKVIGHSVGEVAAAYVAGAYTLEDAVKVIVHRSRLQEKTGGDNAGRMVAVGLSDLEAREVIKGKEHQVQVAVVNSPTLVTLGGDREPLEAIVEELEKAGKFVRWLRINYAFHTHQMEPIKDELLVALADIKPKSTRIPYISTVTGGSVKGEELDAYYWWRNVREAVLFAPAIMNLIRGGERLFVEIGPHPALESPIKECLSELKKKGQVFHSLTRKTDETMNILSNLAGLHNYGIEIDWKSVNQAAGIFVRQPAYPWNRERFWLESEEGTHVRCSTEDHPLLGIRVPATKPTWEFYLDPRLFSYLDDHRFWDSIIFPAAGYGEIGLALAEQIFPGEGYAVEELEAKKALFVSETKIPTVRVVYNDEIKQFFVYSNPTGNRLREWELNAQGRLRKLGEPAFKKVNLADIRGKMADYFDHDKYYKDYAEAGYQFGPNFRHLQNVWRSPNECIAEIVTPEAVVKTLKGYRFHPAILDACFHTVKGAQVIPDGARGSDYFYLPAAVGRIRILKEPIPTTLWSHAHIYFDDHETLISNIMVYDAEGSPVAEIAGFRVERVDQKDAAEEELDNSFYQFQWEKRRLKGSRVGGGAGFAPVRDVVSAVQAATPQIYAEHDLANYYSETVPQVDKIVVQAIINAFLELGWKPRIGDKFTFERLAFKLGIISQHHRLFHAQLETLESEGWLKRCGDDEWEVVEKPQYASVDDDLADMAASGKFTPEIELQQITCPALADVLRGEIDPVELLFPGGSSKKLERFYREGADFPANNKLIQIAVQKLIEKHPARRALRILEVGAGTGSLTRVVLPMLPPDQTEYTFTDNGPTFLADARKAFADYPFMEYATFDIERDLGKQNIDANGYDLILATNVIHATADLKNTLTNLTKCLAEDGILMFLEVIVERPALNNVFGLLKGWWHYKDTDLRKNSALMERSQWTQLLQDLGYREVSSFIPSPDPNEGKQAVFVAKAPAPKTEELASGGALGEPSLHSILVLADQGGVGARLSAKLQEAGARAAVVTAGTAFARQNELSYTINPVEQDNWESLFHCLNEDGFRPTRLVHAWTLDHPGPDNLSIEDLKTLQNTGVQSLRVLVHALHKLKPDPAPKATVITRGRVSINGEKLHAISSAPMTGFARVANNEHPEWAMMLLDLDAVGSAHEVDDLVDEILRPDGEYEVAYRQDLRYLNRLHRVKAEEVPMLKRSTSGTDANVIPYRLQIEKPGVLQNLSLNVTPRRAPGEGEIEIQVKAGGINFRDVMKALGMYPGNPIDIRWFGDDIAGTVVKVGAGVKDVKVGDNVVGMAPYAFRSYVTVHRNLVFKKPDHLSFEEAATLPTVFLTSHYALVHLSRMEKGERVLIHAGTGGVGSAAIQIAKNLGLEIFSTAGSDDKRQLLRDQGVHHVMNSRTLDFADDIMRITNGEGVDCVLNSLAGDFIPKSFSVLRRFGRFVEIGKIDIYNNSKIGLECLKNNISYFVVDLAQHLETKPAYVASMLRELEKEFYAKTYEALPHKVFPITEVVDAFRFMAQGKHVGKNVLKFDVPNIQVGPCTQEGYRFRDDCTYLITGGAGGFGFELAKWMAKNGAKNLSLVSRSGPKEDAQKDIEKLRAEGVNVRDDRADATDRAGIKKVIDAIQKTKAPLGGVIHGAMVLDDLDIIDLDEEKFNKVVYPKMLGVWNLHQLTLNIPLDLFVSFSSFSTVMGAVRQANYNAGNAFLDAISQHRNSLGLPALTFNWGALTGAGFVERNEKTAQYLEMLGLKAYNMDETLRVFGRFISRKAVNLAASRIDWNSLSRFAALIGNSKTYSLVVGEEGEGEGGAVRSQILHASPEARQGLMEDFLAEQVAGVFGTEVSKIDRDTPLNALGLDSLMAIELMNRVESQLGISVPMGAVLNGPNVRELAVPVLETLIDSAGDELAQAGGGASTGAVVSNLPALESSGEDVREFALTEGQKALWFLHKLAPESPAYNLVFSSKISPLVDIETMKSAFQGLYKRHPMLDVTFHTVNGVPVQRVHTGRTVDFREHDASALSNDEIKKLLVTHANKPFNLETGPMVRLELFRTNDQAHVALLSMHHIVSDAWSVTLFMNDLIESYFSKRLGKEPEWEPLKTRYHDFVRWEQTHLAGESGNRMLNYWKDHLGGAPLTLDLPTDRPRPPIQTFNGSAYGFKLDADLTQKIQKLAAEANATLFTTLLSGFEVLLHRYCSQDDLVVGVPLAGRNQPQLHQLIGYFINPVAVRSQVADDPSVWDYLSRNSGAVVGAIENQQYPISRLLEHLHVPRDPSRSPIFQVSFSMERIPGVDEQGIAVFLIGQGGHKFHIADMTVETVDLTLRQAQFEITLVVEEAGGQIYGCWQYNADLFDETTISYLNTLYAQVLAQMTEHPERRLSQINLLPKKEETRILKNWNKTDTEYPRGELLHDLVTGQVSRTPDKVALRSGGDTLTFRQLDRKADGLALMLANEGIGPDQPVAVLTERSCDMVVGTLGVLKAGGCYVPMDPEFPAYRLEQMLADAQPRVIVTQRAIRHQIPQGNWKLICLEDVQPASETLMVDGLTPDSLAYIIYTSGSTGTPKGVEIPHQAAVNFLSSMRSKPGLSESDRLLAVTTMSFDISLLELYLPLLTGAEAVIASREEVKDGRHLGHMLDEFDITVMQATPATWQMLMNGGWAGKKDLRVLCGGEPLPRELANQLVDRAGEVWNLYGPTETTVWSTLEKVKRGDDAITIGKPIANTQVYVLDHHRHPVPVGFVGDLYIGGDGLARGYHNQPELTRGKFVDVSFTKGKPERLYYTGDLARWNKDGKLECLGRSDFQIKLRGVRMELDDIEAQLAAHSRVSQAVVTKRDDLPGGPALVAYIIPTGDREGLVQELRSHVIGRLPESMRPAFYSLLDEFPLTANKKIDRKRLPAPQIDRSGLETAYVAPQTASERLLADIFSDAFETDQFGIRDNFFEMGGDSLLAVRILSHVSEAFNRNVPVGAFLRYPTIEQLAMYLHSTDGQDDSSEGGLFEVDLERLAQADHVEVQFVDDDSELPQVNAVAIATIPDALAGVTGFTRDELLGQWFKQRPLLANVYELPTGKIGLIVLPRFEHDLFKDEAGLKKSILEALEMAASMGAKTVSLTGMLPSATDHGRQVVQWIGDRTDLPAITTGDATRTATIIKTIEGTLDKAGRKFAAEQVAFVGLGSIGKATVELALEVLPHPKAILLCDPYMKEADLEKVRDEVRARGYKGELTIHPNGGGIPASVYEASFVVGTTSIPGILDISRVKPGTIIVDYSFPPSFHTVEAVKRFENRNDILFTTGGELHLGTQIQETIYLPARAQEFANGVDTRLLSILAGRDPNEITGCIVVSLLTGLADDVKATLGPVSRQDVLTHYQFLAKQGFKPALLQMQRYFLSPERIETFREKRWEALTTK